MLKACRTCLGLIDVDSFPFYEIEAEDAQLSTDSCRFKLSSIVPEMELKKTPKSLICAECHGSLEALFEFKEKCLRTENIILRYLRAKPDLDIGGLDLKDVLAFDTSYFDEDIKVEAFDEVNTFDDSADEKIAVVKHEVDDYSSESVDVVSPADTDVELKEEVKRKGFDNELSLDKRVDVHSTFEKYQCDKCHQCFMQKYHLKKHLEWHENMRLQTDDRPYICTICSLDCYSDTGLARHKAMIHAIERPYHCDACNMNFRKLANLTIHRKTHSGIEKKCKICDESFVTSGVLKTHMRTHTGEKPYGCKLCDQRFAYNSGLTVHLRRHNGDLPYVCAVCRKGFTSSSQLTRHRRSHARKKPYQCEMCDHSFVLKSSLTKHLRVHNS